MKPHIKSVGVPAFITFVGAIIATFGAFGSPWISAAGGVLAALGAVWSAKEQNELSETLMQKNEELAKMAQETTNLITGGPTVCYLTPMGLNPSCASIVTHGEHPLYNVSVRIADLELADQKRRTGIPPKLGDDLEFMIGDMPPNCAKVIGYQFALVGDRRRWNIFFSARNGFFTQLLRMRLVNGKWHSAIRVFRPNGHDVAFERVSDEFPREADGSVRWE